MKKILIIVLSIITISCEDKETLEINKDYLYAYNTTRFNEWEDSKKIKLKEAFEIHYEYALENMSNKRNFEGYPLSYAYNNNYVFSTVTNIHKLGKFNLTGIWVNAETGEVKEVKISPEESFDTNGHIWKSYYGKDH